MAYRIYTDALIVAKVFDDGISYEWLANHAQAGLGNALDATGAEVKVMAFAYYIQQFWLHGQVLGVGSENTTSYKKRGWHHWEMVKPYTPKPRSWNVRYRNVGMYAGDGNAARSLNYQLKNLRRTHNEKFMSKAWKAWGGPTNTREELTWMIEHGLNKLFLESQKRQEEEIRRQEANTKADAFHLVGRRYGT